MNPLAHGKVRSGAMVRQILRSVPFYVDFRRWHREGFLRTVSRYALWSQILRTPPVRTLRIGDDNRIEVHLLCYVRDYLTAMWALKTFYWQSGVDYPLAIHFHGHIPELAHRRLSEHFPQARILTYGAASTDVSRILGDTGFARLRAWRDANGFMLKLVDFNLLNQGQVMLALDSDLLFFRPPSEIIAAAESAGGSNTITVQRDIESTYNIDAVHAKSKWGIDLPEQVNTGVIVCRRDGLSLEQCEQWLGDPDVARPTGWVEQTLYAMSAATRVRYLPDTYLVSRQANLDQSSLIMRHYAGDTRKLLTDEGMPYLVKSGFLESCNKTKTF
jgi:hypothetical protein